MKVNLQRVVVSLTRALDFVGIDEVHHGQRVALLANSIAHELGWPTARCRKMLYAGMLHDCGVARTNEHRQLTASLEWEGADEHCVRGERYLLACLPLAHFAPIVRWHHTRWQVLSQLSVPEDCRVEANLIFLADRTDVLLAPYVKGGMLCNEVLWDYPQIVDQLAAYSGKLFHPQLIDAFERAATREAFWLQVDPTYIADEIDERLQGEEPVDLDSHEALAIAQLFARTTDSKSIYTLEHSTRVARIARFLAEKVGIDQADWVKVEIASLLHDIGKLRVPEEIIDKPGPITQHEQAIIKRHSFDTGWILKKVFPGEAIGDWASMHHENLAGTGYPSHLVSQELPLQARLIAVADIFQALSQKRPYRESMAQNEVMALLDSMCAKNRLDRRLVEIVRGNLDHCYRLAVD